MIEDFFTTSFDVYRESWTNNKSTESQVASFNGHIQKTSDMGLTEQLDTVLTKTFDIFCPLDANVEEGDKLKDSSHTYSVKVVRNLDTGNNTHKKLVVERATS